MSVARHGVAQQANGKMLFSFYFFNSQIANKNCRGDDAITIAHFLRCHEEVGLKMECARHKLHSLLTTPEYYSNLNALDKGWARKESASDEKCIRFSITFALLLSPNINSRMRNEVRPPYCRAASIAIGQINFNKISRRRNDFPA